LIRFVLALITLCCGCGLQSVELAPEPGEIILLDPVPSSARERLANAADVKVEPRLALSYPDDGCAIPANLGPLEFVFADEMKPMMMDPMKEPKPKYSAYELRIRAGDSDLRLYTAETRASVPEARWQVLMAVGAELTITLRALEGATRVLESPPLHIQVLAPLRSDEITYWSEPRAAAVATTLHGESRIPPAGYPAIEPWESVSADSSRRALTELGVLSLVIAGLPVPLPWGALLEVAESDWSPDGASLVFATSATMAEGAPPPMMMTSPMMMRAAEPPSPARASLRVSQVSASGASSPELLLEATEPDELLRSPAYSPDGSFIAFERLKARDKQGKLWWMRSDGSAASALSLKMSWSGEGAWPTWLSSESPDQSWLVFSQARAPGSDKLAGEAAQLWAVALRREGEQEWTLAGAPFWLPGQAPTDHNRRALPSAP
jgi:hypothetical protein